MSRRAQRVFDGMAVTKPKARFTGTFELEESEYDSSPLDNTVVCVVVAKIGDLVIKVTDDEVLATRVFKVSEMRMLEDGPLKTQIVEQLGLYGFDTLPLDIPAPKPWADSVVPVAVDGEIVEVPAPVDADTGEVTRAEPNDFFEEDEPVEDVVAAFDAEVTRPALRSGPKVVPFNPDDFDDNGRSDTEVVGSIYDGIHQDPRVAAFANESPDRA